MPDPIPRDGGAFARELAALRQRAGLTQAQVAALLDADVSTVSRWERGERVPAAALRRAVLERLRRRASEMSRQERQ